MRQIAGGSQSGLRKFLATYPSIFRIDGDLVSYNVNPSLVKPGYYGDNNLDSPSASLSDQSGNINSNQQGSNNSNNNSNSAQQGGRGCDGNQGASIDHDAVEYFRERLVGIFVVEFVCLFS